MVLSLDPRIPLVWRSPDTLQFGVDVPRLVLHPVSLAEERMISALADGVSPAGLRMIAKRSRVGPGTVAALLARLDPVFERPEDARHTPFAIVDGEGPTAARIVAHLRDAGAEVGSGLSWSDARVESASVAVIVGSYAIEPSRHARWLRRDRPHLPIVFGETRVVVGPLVRPGRGACVRCVDLHRTDADPAWPALATQLHRRPRPGETALVIDAVAATATALALSAVDFRTAPALPAPLPGRRGRRPPSRRATVATSQSFDPETGLWSATEHMPHPECGCLALPLSPPAAASATSAPPGVARRPLPARPSALGPQARPESGTAAAPPDDQAASRDATS